MFKLVYMLSNYQDFKEKKKIFTIMKYIRVVQNFINIRLDEDL